MTALEWPDGRNFSPTANTCCFKCETRTLICEGIYVRSLSGNESGSRRLIGSDWTAHYGSGHLLFLDGSTLMAQPFDVTRLELSGTSAVGGARRRRLEHRLWRVLRVGNRRVGVHGRSFEPERAAMGGSLGTDGETWWRPKGDYVDLSLSPDQSRVAYSRVDPQSQAPDVWILDLARGTSTRITSERLVDASPIWSPNGDQIIFRSNRSSTIGVELYLTTSSPGGTTRRIYGLEDAGRKHSKQHHALLLVA